MAEWFVYMIRCRDRSLYTGITTDLARRTAEHAGSGKGAKALRGKCPLTLVWSMKTVGRSQASRIERTIKRMSKDDKEKLIQTSAVIDDLSS